MYILAIETSCDETSVSVLKDSAVLSNVVASSSNLFEETGGVVPEVASRKQLEYIIPVLQKALIQAKITIDQLDLIGVTVGPGLMGSLMVGVNFAKCLSAIYSIPLVPINHLIGHIYSGFITNYLGEDVKNDIKFPILSLLVSGGHTDLVLIKTHKDITYLGGTRDDASGEAFDKVARILGLSNYLGGPLISKKSLEFKKAKVKGLKLPRPLIGSNDFDFSFSGLKTAVLNSYKDYSVAEVSNEFEQSVVDVLLKKTQKAYEIYNPKTIIVSGGVSANSRLRNTFKKLFGNKVIFPLPLLCGDNAAMVGCAAYFYKEDATFNLDKINADPSLSLQNLT